MFQLAEFCRICLSKTNELLLIENRDEDNLCINEKLIYINPHLIPLDDQYPKRVCVSCKEQINDAYCLLARALDSYNVLDKIISRLQVLGQRNIPDILDGDGEIRDLLEAIPEIKEEIEFEHSIVEEERNFEVNEIKFKVKGVDGICGDEAPGGVGGDGILRGGGPGGVTLGVEGLGRGISRVEGPGGVTSVTSRVEGSVSVTLRDEGPGGVTSRDEGPGCVTSRFEGPGDVTSGFEGPGGVPSGFEGPGGVPSGFEGPGLETQVGISIDEAPGTLNPGNRTSKNEVPGIETPGDKTPTDKDTTNVLKIRSISSINAIIHSSQSQEESILGDTTQDPNFLGAPSPKPPAPIIPAKPKTIIQVAKKGKAPVTVLFNPKSGRIIPLKKPAKPAKPPKPSNPATPGENTPQHPFSKYLAECAQNYTCKICNKTFHSQIGFTVHKNWHEKLDRQVPGIEHQCDYCPQGPFKTLGDLKKHLNEHSTHFKRFMKSKQRQEELRTGKIVLPGIDLHNMPTRPVCGQCKKSFSNFGDLNRHRRYEKHEVHKLYNTRKD